MARAKTFQAIHPLRMADALLEINTRAGNLVMHAHNARDLAQGANEAQLRTLLESVCKAADDLKAALWTEDEG